MKLKLGTIALAAIVAGTSGWVAPADAGGVLTIGRRDDSTTFDPIKSAQNVDFWIYGNVFDVLIRVDRSGLELQPGLAESWEVSDDGLTYTFHLRETGFSDGTPVTAGDAAFSLLRLRDDETSLWNDSYAIIDTAEAKDDRTLVITLKSPSAPFLATLAMPSASVISKAAVEKMGIDAYAEAPVASGAFTIKEWRRGDRVILERNPHSWEAGKVDLDGIEWISVPDDNTRMLSVQAGQLDAAIFVPFSRVAELRADPNLNVIISPSTREDHLLINHEHGALANKEVRQALDMAIDKDAIVDIVTFGLGTVADSYIPDTALYHDKDALHRPYDPDKAREMLAEAGASDLTLDYVVNAGSEVDEQLAVLIQQQVSKAGITLNLQKVDPSQSWDMLIDGAYDVSVMYWVNDIIDPDQKTSFVLGHDSNMNYMTRYHNDEVKDLVAAARIEMDPAEREAMYMKIQKIAKDDVHWIDLYYSPFISVTRTNVDDFFQNPLGRFFFEDTVKN